MPTLRYRLVNVFAESPLAGNPLCVFEDGSALDTATMQALALQFNLSETTFILPATASGADAHVRIFTPGFEMPFAGHPTLGTASVVGAGAARVTLEMKAGLVQVTRQGISWTLRAARPPATRPVAATRDELARMVGLPSGSLSDRPLRGDTGVEQLVIPIVTPELVRAAVPVAELLERHGHSRSREEPMAYLWSRGEPEWSARF